MPFFVLSKMPQVMNGSIALKSGWRRHGVQAQLDTLGIHVVERPHLQSFECRITGKNLQCWPPSFQPFGSTQTTFHCLPEQGKRTFPVTRKHVVIGIFCKKGRVLDALLDVPVVGGPHPRHGIVESILVAQRCVSTGDTQHHAVAGAVIRILTFESSEVGPSRLDKLDQFALLPGLIQVGNEGRDNAIASRIDRPCASR